MLKERVISALIGLPVVLVLFVYGPPWLFLTLFLIFVGLSTYEMAHMLVPKMEATFGGSAPVPHKPDFLDMLGGKGLEWVAVILACAMFVGSAYGAASQARGLVLFGILGSILIGCFLAPSNDQAFGRVVCLLVAICYGSFPWLATWDLYVMGSGARYVILLLAIVWAGDTGAYFGGRAFGKHPLAPRMSPKKTWEGAIAGIFASVLGGVLANKYYGGTLGTWPAIILASVCGGVFGQLGDLVESTFKRFSGVKDSGALIPGHGGFLDRVDGLLFAAPVVWFILDSLH